MSRVKQLRTIDSLMVNINAVLKNRDSLSDGDVKVLTDALAKLELLRKKRGELMNRC